MTEEKVNGHGRKKRGVVQGKTQLASATPAPIRMGRRDDDGRWAAKNLPVRCNNFPKIRFYQADIMNSFHTLLVYLCWAFFAPLVLSGALRGALFTGHARLLVGLSELPLFHTQMGDNCPVIDSCVPSTPRRIERRASPPVHPAQPNR